MTKQKKKMRLRNKIIIAISIVLVILIAVAIGIYIYIINSPQWALKGILTDVKADGIAGLKAHSTEDFCVKIEKIEKFAEEKGIDLYGSDTGDADDTDEKDADSKDKKGDADKDSDDDGGGGLADYIKGYAKEYLAARLLKRIKTLTGDSAPLSRAARKPTSRSPSNTAKISPEPLRSTWSNRTENG
jgi:hypothetical protein